MDKTLLLVLFPFFTIVLILGFVAYYARGGRPILIKLKGLGITFELKSSTDVLESSEHAKVRSNRSR